MACASETVAPSAGGAQDRAPAGAAEPAPSKADLKPAERERVAEARTIHNHDGFYLRLGPSFGYGTHRAKIAGEELVGDGLTR